MSWGNGAPRGWPGTSTSQLNDTIPYLSWAFPANEIIPGAIKPTTFKTVRINAQEQAHDVHEFPGGANSECFCYLPFRGIPIDLVNPSFKIAPYFMQDNDVLAPSPDQFGFFEFAIGASYNGTTLDYSLEGLEETSQCLVDDAWKPFMTSITGDKAVGIPNLDGDGALSVSKFNYLSIQIERFGTSGSDTYPNSIYLLGFLLQYKTDFSSIEIFPT